jgi:hypothetical protein
MEHWWNDPGRGKLKYWVKNVLVPLCPPQILQWTDPGSNPGLRGDRPATSGLKPWHGHLKSEINLDYM